jgi:hypothetical protein
MQLTIVICIAAAAAMAPVAAALLRRARPDA